MWWQPHQYQYQAYRLCYLQKLDISFRLDQHCFVTQVSDFIPQIKFFKKLGNPLLFFFLCWLDCILVWEEGWGSNGDLSLCSQRPKLKLYKWAKCIFVLCRILLALHKKAERSTVSLATKMTSYIHLSHPILVHLTKVSISSQYHVQN